MIEAYRPRSLWDVFREKRPGVAPPGAGLLEPGHVNGIIHQRKRWRCREQSSGNQRSPLRHEQVREPRSRLLEVRELWSRVYGRVLARRMLPVRHRTGRGGESMMSLSTVMDAVSESGSSACDKYGCQKTSHMMISRSMVVQCKPAATSLHGRRCIRGFSP